MTTIVLSGGPDPQQIAAWAGLAVAVIGALGGLLAAYRSGQIKKDIATTVTPIGQTVDHISDQVTTNHSLTLAEIAEQTRSEQILRKAPEDLTDADREHLASMREAGRDTPKANGS